MAYKKIGKKQRITKNNIKKYQNKEDNIIIDYYGQRGYGKSYHEMQKAIEYIIIILFVQVKNY